MRPHHWSYTQFSQFNYDDTLLLVSGVFVGPHNSSAGEIAVFSIGKVMESKLFCTYVIFFYERVNTCTQFAEINVHLSLPSPSFHAHFSHFSPHLLFFLTLLTFVLFLLAYFSPSFFVDGFNLLSRVRNKPYDVFGCWLNNAHLISGNLHRMGRITSCSVLWLNKAFQVSSRQTYI